MPAQSMRTWKLCQKQLIDQVRAAKPVRLPPFRMLTVVQERFYASRQ